jgi:putative ATP-dependent endonuclease of OLD family
MYLSRLFIKNYRSIRELDMEFSKGKNIIFGRNNSGKSNIIKAIDLVLGENVPTYARAENITKSDFYSWKEEVNGTTTINTSDEISIWCELTRDPGESLNYDEMCKCYSFPICTNIWNKPRRIGKDKLPRDFESIFNLNEDNSDKCWITSKNVKSLESHFEDKFSFAFALKAKRDEEDNIIKEIRFLDRENSMSDWILSFRAPIRNEFLQSAIIPSFGRVCHLLNWHSEIQQFLQAPYVIS